MAVVTEASGGPLNVLFAAVAVVFVVELHAQRGLVGKVRLYAVLMPALLSRSLPPDHSYCTCGPILKEWSLL